MLAQEVGGARRAWRQIGGLLAAVWAGLLFAPNWATAEVKMTIKEIAGQAELGTVEIHGVAAGDFQVQDWEQGRLYFLPDARKPLLSPRLSGVFRNIYAPSAVDLGDGWRLFYGAWDGVGSGNDRIYSTPTRDFLDFGEREIVIEHGEFVHVCNVSALRLPDKGYRLVCTGYPDARGLNKPVVFSSPDGVVWNDVRAPYPARRRDLVEMEGYAKYPDADINGMNVLLHEDDHYRLYFGSFRDFGQVYRASSRDGKRFDFDGAALDFPAMVNDVKKFRSGGSNVYLMGLHMNGDRLWYCLSRDGRAFGPPKELARNLGEADRYIVALGWVVKGNRLLGFLYGAGEVPSLDRNRIWARWLQKKVVFVGADGARYEPSSSLGPDRQLLLVPRDRAIEGHFEVYGEDGQRRLAQRLPGVLRSGRVYVLESR